MSTNGNGWINNRSLESATAHGEEDPLLGRDGDDEKHPSRDGTASAFAVGGLIWTIIVVQAVVRWILSDDFGAPKIDKTDEIPNWNLVMLRIFEASSVGVLLAHVWFCILLPVYPGLRQFRLTAERGQFSLDGRHVLGGLLAVFADGFLNGQGYIFHFNQYSVNIGVWSHFMPFHNPQTSSKYAESILWGMYVLHPFTVSSCNMLIDDRPMYIYFCAGFGIIGCGFATKIRNRFPQLTNAGVFTLVWIIEYVIDFSIENIVIRLTRAYGFGVTYAPLTLWAGTWYQFPIYESAFVATLGCCFTAMRLKAYDAGMSPIERGYHHWPRAMHGTIRTFAVIGFCAACVIVFYHLPLTWFGMMGKSVADMPSYMAAL